MSESKIVPNTFQCFNAYVDRAMQHLTDAELRVLLFATRHILGWQDRISSRQARISLSRFEHGFTWQSDDGKTVRLAGCGLGRPAISKATVSLCEFGFLKKVGDATLDGQQWELGDAPNWTMLEARSQARLAQNKSRTTKSRGVLAEKRGGGLSDKPVLSDELAGGLSDKHNESHIQSQEQNQEDQVLSAPQADAVETSTSVEGIAVSPEITTNSETERTETQQAARPRTERQQMIDFCMDFWQCPGGEGAMRADQLLGRSKSGKWKDANLTPAASIDEAKGWRLWIERSHKERPNAAWQIEKTFISFRASSAYQDAIREANEPVHIVIPPAEITPPEIAQARAQEYRATIAALAAGKRLIPERTTHESAA